MNDPQKNTTGPLEWAKRFWYVAGRNDAELSARRPYSTAPKDGRLIGLFAEDVGGPFPMRWDPDAVNPLLGDVRGLWVMADGSMTWSDHDPEYAPTHWQEIVS